MDPDSPSAPEINGPSNCKVETEYTYTFKSTSPKGRQLYYYIDWGDKDWKTMRWIGPYNSGEEVTISHTWTYKGEYTIKARVKDTNNLWGPWGTLDVTIPRDKATSNMLLLRLLERFPLFEKILLFHFILI